MNSSAHPVVEKLLVGLLIATCQDVATKLYVSDSAQLCCILWKDMH